MYWSVALNAARLTALRPMSIVPLALLRPSRPSLLLVLSPSQSVGSGMWSVAPGMKAATPGEIWPLRENGQTTHTVGSRALACGFTAGV